ncbi:Crp/Fnr family transcriptional regulator [Flavobacterium psychrotrophum]|uniref:Crp/Fnr family transcriptional regulator n=1 Tax=Flavobacterium psychrotrophum TaxID=2294119 RepID=UPI000E31E80A|nr:Crp/Fnr family transcriptional regulator [Flavobacterium psychrotrophum]
MSHIFKKHLEKFIEISDEEFQEVLPYFTQAHLKKKETIMEKGQICNYHYFVLEGCLRKFFINDKGVEHTTEFAIETWWITDNIAYEHLLQSEFSIQAVERSEILMISHAAQEELLTMHPKMERYFRFVYQRAYAASQMRIKYLYDYTREELYLHFCKKHPYFIQRIPQYLIASFLGFTPEYLSELRRKMLS